MKVNVYSVHDAKAQSFAPPFCMQHDGQALRAFGDAVEDEKSQMSKHSGDFALYCIGTYDDSEGKIEGLSTPKFLARASDFKVVSVA